MDLSVRLSDLFTKDRVHLQMLRGALLLGQSETCSQWIRQNGKEAFKALLSEIKWSLIEAINDFLLAYTDVLGFFI